MVMSSMTPPPSPAGPVYLANPGSALTPLRRHLHVAKGGWSSLYPHPLPSRCTLEGLPRKQEVSMGRSQTGEGRGFQGGGGVWAPASLSFSTPLAPPPPP